MASTNAAKPTTAETVNGLQNLATKSDKKILSKPASRRAQALTVIGTITKSHAMQLRVAISECRGQVDRVLSDSRSVEIPSTAEQVFDIDATTDILSVIANQRDDLRRRLRFELVGLDDGELDQLVDQIAEFRRVCACLAWRGEEAI
jgi:hypothetical protein